MVRLAAAGWHLTSSGSFEPAQELIPKLLQLRIGISQHPNDILRLVPQLELLCMLLADVRRRRRPCSHGQFIQTFRSTLQLQKHCKIALLLNVSDLNFGAQIFTSPLQHTIVLGSLLDGLLQLPELCLPLSDFLLSIAIRLGAEFEVVTKRLHLPLDVGGVACALVFLGLRLELQGNHVTLVDSPLHLDDHLFLSAFQLLEA
mmetsp:Transcript_3117/g.4864  ORF Transcript_3117/g.4864 Transcript_3117/m.4864 type:complete len:202 (+) Transcript_3117:107-712(+)